MFGFDNEFEFVIFVEVGFNGMYCLIRNWFLFGGYKVFWIDGVVLVSE